VTRGPSKWALLAALFVVLVVADQATKYLAVERLTTIFQRTGETGLARLSGFYSHLHLEQLATDPVYVWKPVWRWNYVENPGAAWGLFRTFSPGFRNVFFLLVSLGAVGFILHYYRKLQRSERFLQVALAFVLAGAVGNFVDRLARKYVIDFVEWYWWNRPDLRWPTFNVADSLIVVGVAMLVLHPGPAKARAAPEKDKEAGAA
jgi:signal peptidase II